MDQLVQLKQKAKVFQELLEKYAKTDDDVKDYLCRMQPWFVKINNGEIIPPYYDWKLSTYFSFSDISPLAERYIGTDLANACSQFTLVIRGMSLTEGK